MSYWPGAVRAGPTCASARVCQSVMTDTPRFWASKSSPTIRSGIGLPPSTMVTVPPTALPVRVRKPVDTTAWPGPVYQCPLMIG